MQRCCVLRTPDEGAYLVTVPMLPGITILGVTVEGTLANAHEATGLHVQCLAGDGEVIPLADEPPQLATVTVALPTAPTKSV
ncbi:MAG: type II toxin-antitoxin system HicB family antitoxin [Chloroflexi bacterium]|nr:type II toxin-antitoxin system HicB family antitoxin [Chloroflexota bacterium]